MTTTDIGTHDQVTTAGTGVSDHLVNGNEKATGKAVAASAADGLVTELEALLKLLESEPWGVAGTHEPAHWEVVHWRNAVQSRVYKMRTCQSRLVAQQAAQREAVHQPVSTAEGKGDLEAHALGWLKRASTSTDASTGRIHELELALASVIARIERAGGYVKPEEQDVLREAKAVLAGESLMMHHP